jgi:hypothetical protein
MKFRGVHVIQAIVASVTVTRLHSPRSILPWNLVSFQTRYVTFYDDLFIIHRTLSKNNDYRFEFAGS